ncbi:MAG TPA: hypothetical protein VGQ76_28735 [Thermoanaerobaculia bacterium]|jgi:hypothetical protein|nr:hypothetical protein [Thermoanaerobaculia bacterium]
MRQLLLLLALLDTVPAAAQLSKKPWMLTVDERIALRTDPELAQERVRRCVHRQTSNAAMPNVGPDADAFDGKSHPELFLPCDVFAQFADFAFRDARSEQAACRALSPDVKRLGLPADFFGRLRLISTVYLSDRSSERQVRNSLSKLSGRPRQRAEELLALKRTDLCRSRAEALANARSAFGHERFDQFLYEVMAVNMFTVTDRLPDPGLLRQLESGCSKPVPEFPDSR